MALLSKDFLQNLAKSPNDFDCLPRGLQVACFVQILREHGITRVTPRDLSELFAEAEMRAPGSGKKITLSERKADEYLQGLARKGEVEVLATGAYRISPLRP